MGISGAEMTDFLLNSRVILGAHRANRVLFAAALPLVLPVVRWNPFRYIWADPVLRRDFDSQRKMLREHPD